MTRPASDTEVEVRTAPGLGQEEPTVVASTSGPDASVVVNGPAVAPPAHELEVTVGASEGTVSVSPPVSPGPAGGERSGDTGTDSFTTDGGAVFHPVVGHSEVLVVNNGGTVTQQDVDASGSAGVRFSLVS